MASIMVVMDEFQKTPEVMTVHLDVDVNIDREAAKLTLARGGVKHVVVVEPDVSGGWRFVVDGAAAAPVLSAPEVAERLYAMQMEMDGMRKPRGLRGGLEPYLLLSGTLRDDPNPKTIEIRHLPSGTKQAKGWIRWSLTMHYGGGAVGSVGLSADDLRQLTQAEHPHLWPNVKLSPGDAEKLAVWMDAMEEQGFSSGPNGELRGLAGDVVKFVPMTTTQRTDRANRKRDLLLSTVGGRVWHRGSGRWATITQPADANGLIVVRFDDRINPSRIWAYELTDGPSRPGGQVYKFPGVKGITDWPDRRWPKPPGVQIPRSEAGKQAVVDNLYNRLMAEVDRLREMGNAEVNPRDAWELHTAADELENAWNLGWIERLYALRGGLWMPRWEELQVLAAVVAFEK